MNDATPRAFWKFSGSLTGLLALLAVLVAVNLLLGQVRLRLDLTEDRLYTLSDGTRAVLRGLDGPVTLKLFFSSSVREVPEPLKLFARQVEDLLREYALASRGKVVVETYDPKPDSDAEEWAERYGLASERLDPLDPPLYLGLVAAKGDALAALPFLDPRNEQMLEYHVSQLIARVANPRKPVLGVLSSLPVMGVRSFPYAMPGQPRPKNQPPWVAFQDLAKDYDVRQLPAETESIEADVDVLVLVHPKSLSRRTLYAIDQFVLRGGRLLAFVDPMCLADAMNQDNPMGMGMTRPASDLGPLTEAWGLTFDSGKAVADLDASTRIRRGDNQVEDNPVFLTLRPENLDGRDLATSALKSLSLPGAGAFVGSGAPGLTVGTLVVSSDQSELVDAMMAQMGTDAIRRSFKAGLKRLPLAVRIQGEFPTAFPDGQPKAEVDPDKGPAADADKDKPAETAAPTGLTRSVRPGLVVLVGDVDLLFDAFAVQELPLFGQRVYQPMNDNLALFANLLEQLGGNADLASIRARGRFDRPFERVLTLQREAQQRWLIQEQALERQLETTRERINSLQAQKDKTQRYILSAEQQEEIARFRQENARTQQELKQVRKNLREGIERLGAGVKAVNILAMPALVCLAGLGFAWHRRRRNARD